MHAFNTLYLHLCPSSDSKTEPKSTSSLNNQTRDLDHAYSLTSMQWSALSVVIHPLRVQATLSLPEMSPYKDRVAFSKPVHAARAGIGPPSPNHSTLTAKPSSHHVHINLPHPHPSVPPFLLTQNRRT